MSSLRPLLLPLLLVLDGLMAVAIADRAATLRRSWQIWELRMEAQTRLKNLSGEVTRPAHSLDAPPEPR